MIQHILVGIDGSVYADTALRYGIALAKRFQATLHGLHVVDIVQAESPLLHDLAGAIGAAPLLNLTTQMRHNLELLGQQLLAQFRQTCNAEGLPSVEHLVTGIVPTEILRLASKVDLVLLGRGGLHTRLSKALLGSAVETVVRHNAAPTMVTTEAYAEVQKPLLATDGSPSAMVALHTAIEWVLRFGLPLAVVYCAPAAQSDVSCLEIASARLSAHGVAHEVNVCPGNAHEDLVHYVHQHHHDLLFMGAFGHRRIIEWLLGSTTQYLLRMSPVPLVLCHAEQPPT